MSFEPIDEEVEIDAGEVRLPGHLTVPGPGSGVVVFAHGSGSSRLSPRNRHVAEKLHGLGLGTLLFDLLTAEEAEERANVFDIPLLASRLVAARRWVGSKLGEVPVGYFGASTGAGAALWAAVEPGGEARAIVSRGGRPDLAMPRLREVTTPTLLIVGSRDTEILGPNREAQSRLQGESHLEIIEGASHLFEEPGTLDQVADLAGAWFQEHLAVPT